MEDITTQCNTCQIFSIEPICFKVSLPTEESLTFGQKLSMYLMFLDGKAFLHVVDTSTHFSAATFRDAHGDSYGQSVNGVWLAFVMIRCTIYSGYPNRLRTDQGSIFAFDRWRKLTDMNCFQLHLSSVVAHSSLGIFARYHEPLRRIYRKIQCSHPSKHSMGCLKLETIGVELFVNT